MARRVPWLDDGGHLRRRIILASLLLGFILITTLVVFAAVQFYLNEGEKSKDLMAVYNVNITDVLSDADFADPESKARKLLPMVFLVVKVVEIDPGKYSVKTGNNIYVRTDLVSKDFKFYLGSFTPITIPANRTHYEKDLVLQTEGGDINRYPYDKYKISVDYGMDTGSNITFGAVAYGELQNWRLKMDFFMHYDALHLEIDIKRSPSTRIFSIFIVALMWMVTISVVCITFHFIIRKREVTPPLLGAYVTLLFALPSVRNIQPSVPPIGTVSDVAGLFFNMAIILACLVVLIVDFMWQSPDPHVPPSPLHPIKLKI